MRYVKFDNLYYKKSSVFHDAMTKHQGMRVMLCFKRYELLSNIMIPSLITRYFK